jgi:hypothetical protein
MLVPYCGINELTAAKNQALGICQIVVGLSECILTSLMAGKQLRMEIL